MVEKAYKFRIYPTPRQIELLAKIFGCRRFVYNMFLGKSKWFYDMTGKFLGYKDSSAILTVVKNEEFLWLQEADKFALQNALRDLNKAFVDFFTGKTGYPKRKSKKGRQSYRTNPTNGNIKVLDKAIQLPKLGVVRCVYHRPIDAGANAKLENVTVSRNPDGSYYASLCYSGVEIEKLPEAEGVVGVDLGLRTYAYLSTGEEVDNPKWLKKAEKRLAMLQRRLDSKRYGSSNYKRLLAKINKLQVHIANQRKDFQHKLAFRLVRDNQAVGLEDLQVRNLLKNHKLAKAISDAAWGQFRQFVEYKAGWHGRQAVIVDQFFPSSKNCSACGHKNSGLVLTTREWVCPACGAYHQRDYNASVNIRDETMKKLA